MEDNSKYPPVLERERGREVRERMKREREGYIESVLSKVAHMCYLRS